MKAVSVTKKIAGCAVFAALAYIISFLEFPIFSAAGFLKMDFSNVFIAVSGFAFGPISGVAVAAAKELLCFVTKSSSGGIGEIANFIVTTGFILLPTIVYRYKKGVKAVIITLLFGCVITTGLALIMNRFVTFPLYMGEGAAEGFASLWSFVMLFNLIKSVSVSVITILLYKRISYIIKAIGEKTEKAAEVTAEDSNAEKGADDTENDNGEN